MDFELDAEIDPDRPCKLCGPMKTTEPLIRFYIPFDAEHNIMELLEKLKAAAYKTYVLTYE